MISPKSADSGRLPVLVHLTTVHPRDDVRIHQKEVRSLARHFEAELVLIVADGMGDATDRGIRIVDLGSLSSSRVLRALGGSLFALRHILSFARPPKIVHFHDPELIPLGIILFFLGYRIIYDVHEDLPRDILSKTWIPSAIRPFVGKSAAVVEYLAASIFRGVSAATPTIAKRFPTRKTALVQNFPIEDELLAPSRNAYNLRPQQFAYIGGIAKIRGAKEMVDAIARIGHPNASLVLGGVFQPREFADDLGGMAGWQKTEYVGWKDRRGVAEILASARAGLVLLHPLVNYLDALPVKMFEYMAAGLPVIASDFPLWRTIIDSSQCGFLVDPFDANAVAAAMQWVLDNPREAEQMGLNGRRAIENIYNWNTETRLLFRLYKQILPSLELRSSDDR